MDNNNAAILAAVLANLNNVNIPPINISEVIKLKINNLKDNFFKLVELLNLTSSIQNDFTKIMDILLSSTNRDITIKSISKLIKFFDEQFGDRILARALKNIIVIPITGTIAGTVTGSADAIFLALNACIISIGAIIAVIKPIGIGVGAAYNNLKARVDRFNARKQVRDQIETLNNRIGRDYVNHFDTDIAEINRLFIAINNDRGQTQEEKDKLTGLITAASTLNLLPITEIPVDQFEQFAYIDKSPLKVGGGILDTKNILKSSLSIKNANVFDYSTETDVMNVITAATFDFTRRKDSKTIWFIAAFIYNPYSDCFHLKKEPTTTDAVEPKFFLDFSSKLNTFGYTGNNITLRDSLFSDTYIDEIVQTFYPNDANKKHRVMSLFSNLLTKTADTFYNETRELVATAVPEGYNENKYTVQKTIAPSFGLPYLVMGKLVGKTITFYPKIPPYLFLLDKMAFNKEMVRLDKQKKEEEKLARLIASVVAINEVERQRQVLAEAQVLADRLVVERLREAQVLERERLAAADRLEADRLREAQALEEQQQKALVASIIAINEVERQAAQVLAERLRAAEAARLEAARLEAEAARLEAEQLEEARVLEEAAAEERERLREAQILAEQQQKDLVASVVAINEVEKQREIERDRLAQIEREQLAQIEREQLAQIEREQLAQIERDRLSAQVLEEQRQKDLVASVIAVNKVEQQKQAQVLADREAAQVLADREALEERQAAQALANRQALAERQALAKALAEETSNKSVMSAVLGHMSLNKQQIEEANRKKLAEQEAEKVAQEKAAQEAAAQEAAAQEAAAQEAEEAKVEAAAQEAAAQEAAAQEAAAQEAAAQEAAAQEAAAQEAAAQEAAAQEAAAQEAAAQEAAAQEAAAKVEAAAQEAAKVEEAKVAAEAAKKLTDNLLEINKLQNYKKDARTAFLKIFVVHFKTKNAIERLNKIGELTREIELQKTELQQSEQTKRTLSANINIKNETIEPQNKKNSIFTDFKKQLDEIINFHNNNKTQNTGNANTEKNKDEYIKNKAILKIITGHFKAKASIESQIRLGSKNSNEKTQLLTANKEKTLKALATYDSQNIVKDAHEGSINLDKTQANVKSAIFAVDSSIKLDKETENTKYFNEILEVFGKEEIKKIMTSNPAYKNIINNIQNLIKPTMNLDNQKVNEELDETILHEERIEEEIGKLNIKLDSDITQINNNIAKIGREIVQINSDIAKIDTEIAKKNNEITNKTSEIAGLTQTNNNDLPRVAEVIKQKIVEILETKDASFKINPANNSKDILHVGEADENIGYLSNYLKTGKYYDGDINKTNISKIVQAMYNLIGVATSAVIERPTVKPTNKGTRQQKASKGGDYKKTRKNTRSLNNH